MPYLDKYVFAWGYLDYCCETESFNQYSIDSI